MNNSPTCKAHSMAAQAAQKASTMPPQFHLAARDADHTQIDIAPLLDDVGSFRSQTDARRIEHLVVEQRSDPEGDLLMPQARRHATGIFLTLTMSTTIPALAWIPWMILRRQV
eukprot:CAMPEP_0181227382 /NCGR_PEP_ID=MMETSP1096-20121128/32758_1 /TAXON_ID=156174 ORGANISM="Chrysochromulina ericina, Strain CCMP281" /NCGR_SAMPLE_ID=MMETSP1096 /ASSEMBLY_ACC=CAM_ASM_000453 /LENGTH=112 /DNA_ID=CAMNT_0023320783 /DNA_START=144 /DNA_END=481 /DNA_ORIENTATION=+